MLKCTRRMYLFDAFLIPQQYQFIIIVIVIALVAQITPESSNKIQKAWQVHSYGGFKDLKLEQTTIPLTTASRDLLIKVKATALNPIDSLMLGGYGKTFLNFLRLYSSEFPLVVGREFAGTVIDKGYRVSNNEFKIGDEVYGIVPLERQGTQREYLLADKSHVLPRPSHLSPIEAGSVLFTSITAWMALFLIGGLSAQDTANSKVLILGASGGVGTVAVQILKSQNATVVGTCSTNSVPLVTSLGADYVYDYRNPEYVRQVASHGVYDIILDSANIGHQKIPNDWDYKVFITLDLPVINNTDRYGLVGGLAVSGGELISVNLPGVFNSRLIQWGFFWPVPNAFKFIGKLIQNRQLRPVIQQVFKFSEVPEAFTRLAAGHARGKIVIDLQ